MSVTAGKSWAKCGHTEGDVGENMLSEHRELDSSAVVATTTNGPHLTAGRAAVRWCRTGHLTWSFVPTRDADVRLVGDFVRRLRRVALHPLALVQDLPPTAAACMLLEDLFWKLRLSQPAGARSAIRAARNLL